MPLTIIVRFPGHRLAEGAQHDAPPMGPRPVHQDPVVGAVLPSAAAGRVLRNDVTFGELMAVVGTQRPVAEGLAALHLSEYACHRYPYDPVQTYNAAPNPTYRLQRQRAAGVKHFPRTPFYNRRKSSRATLQQGATHHHNAPAEPPMTRAALEELADRRLAERPKTGYVGTASIAKNRRQPIARSHHTS